MHGVCEKNYKKTDKKHVQMICKSCRMRKSGAEKEKKRQIFSA
jgi:hypothetical protein